MDEEKNEINFDQKQVKDMSVENSKDLSDQKQPQIDDSRKSYVDKAYI